MKTFFGRSSTASNDVVRFGSLRFWAERGLVHIEDARDNSYECISVLTALRRMRAISDMLANSSRRAQYTEDQFDQANRKRHQDMLDGMVIVAHKAQEQGMPSDASARRELVRRRPTTIVVPGWGGGL